MTKLGEKGALLSNIDALSTTFDAKESPLSDDKDTKLISVLQTDQSKVVYESGEPLVVYNGTNAEFTSFAPDIRY